jgi:hypothetical protein
MVWRRSLGGAGGIDQDIDRADAAFDRLDHLVRRRVVNEISGDAECAFQLRAGAVDIVPRARADGDPGAFGGEGASASEANAFSTRR